MAKHSTVSVLGCLTALLLVSGCSSPKVLEISTKPLQSGKKFEDSTKLNWSITWGKIRSSKDGEED